MSPRLLVLMYFTLVSAPLLTATSSHWFLAWMSLEIGVFAIIPVMIGSHHTRATESTTKYFLVQSAGAATLLFAALSNAWLTGEWDICTSLHPTTAALAITALAFKMGLAPLHTWFPEVLQGVDITMGLILCTWQKLATFILLIQIPPQYPSFLIVLGSISILVGGWGGLNQTQLRKLMAYSSIAHMGWAVLIMQIMPPLALLTLVLYILTASAAFLSLTPLSSMVITRLSASLHKLPPLLICFFTIMLSLAGLPPLSGFLPKWLIMSLLAEIELPLLAVILAFGSFLSLYFYLRLCYVVALTTTPSPSTDTLAWRKPSARPTTALSLTSMFAALLLPLAPGLTALFW